MDIREAKYIIEIARTKHITKAANNLYITQPALSKSLKKLEQEFGASLFYRDGNELLPTEIGNIVLKKSAVILDEFQKMNDDIHNIKNLKDNLLRVSLPEMGGFYTSQVITDFIKEHPDLHLIIQELGGNDTIQMFQENQLDIGFLLRPFHLENCNAHLFYTSEMVVAVPTDHPFAEKDAVSFTDFHNRSYVTMSTNYQFVAQLGEHFAEHKVNATPQMLSKDTVGLINYSKNTGIPCILPEISFFYYGYAPLILRRFTPSFPWQLYIVYPRDNEKSALIRSFVDYILENFRA